MLARFQSGFLNPLSLIGAPEADAQSVAGGMPAHLYPTPYHAREAEDGTVRNPICHIDPVGFAQPITVTMLPPEEQKARKIADANQFQQSAQEQPAYWLKAVIPYALVNGRREVDFKKDHEFDFHHHRHFPEYSGYTDLWSRLKHIVQFKPTLSELKKCYEKTVKGEEITLALQAIHKSTLRRSAIIFIGATAGTVFAALSAESFIPVALTATLSLFAGISAGTAFSRFRGAKIAAQAYESIRKNLEALFSFSRSPKTDYGTSPSNYHSYNYHLLWQAGLFINFFETGFIPKLRARQRELLLQIAEMQSDIKTLESSGATTDENTYIKNGGKIPDYRAEKEQIENVITELRPLIEKLIPLSREDITLDWALTRIRVVRILAEIHDLLNTNGLLRLLNERPV